MRNALHVGFTAIMWHFLAAGVASAATINVPGDFATIQEAVNTASNGDTILVAPGVHFGFLEEGVVDMLGKEISLLSTDGPQKTFIDGEFTRRGINCASGETPNTIIDGFTIVGGSAFEGGGILCSGSSPTIRNCVVDGNSASFGGGVRCTTSSGPLFEDCQFAGNFSDFCGGAIACAFDSEITLTRCEIIKNFAISFGGGLFMEIGCNANVSDSLISGNSTEFDGGGIWSSGSSGTFSNTEITDNFALNSAGGIYSESSAFVLEGVLLSGNLAEFEGGALVAIESDVDLIHSVLAQNSSFGKTQSSIVVDSESVVFAEETSFFGEEVDGTIAFGLCNEFFLNSKELLVVSQLRPTATFQSIQPAVNAASDGTLIVVMKGVYTDSGQEVVDMLGKQIVLNSTGNVDDVVIDGEGQRRGIVCQNGEPITTHIKGFTIRNCITPGGETVGAGIYCDASDATISCCKIIDNVADEAGGGIGSENSGSQLVYDCLISQNTVTSFKGGGGYYNEGGAPTIRDCIVSSNIAPDGGGIYFESCSSLLIKNTEIFFNRTHPSSTGDGGGVFVSDCLGASKITLCLIDKNDAHVRGGGIFVRAMDLIVEECTVAGNLSGQNGGGIHCDSPFGAPATEVTLKSTAVDGNGALFHGGGVYVDNGVSLVVNSQTPPFNDTATIQLNCALAGGGIFATGGSSVFLEQVNVLSNDALGIIPDGDGGGGIKCTDKAALTLDDCFISSNESNGNGGGIHLDNASAIINSNIATQISNNHSESGGGIRAISSSLELVGTSFIANSAAEFGGGLDLESCTGTTVQSCVFQENAAKKGGAIGVFDMTQVFEDLGIFDNEAIEAGGGIHGVSSTLDLINITVDRNSSEDKGAGMSLSGCNTIMNGVDVTNNTSEGDGGGVYIDQSKEFISVSEIGATDISNNVSESGLGAGICYMGAALGETHSIRPGTTITNNTAGQSGGGVYVENMTLDIASSDISNNTALGVLEGAGGACSIKDAKVTCANTDFIGNTTVRKGGAIHALNSEVSFDTCDISENTATFANAGSIGGGAFLDSTEGAFKDCLFFENVADDIGGGLAAIDSTVGCTDCNFNLNQAVDGSGGGLFIQTTSLSITGGLIDENSCIGDGGGIAFVSSSEECLVDDVIFDTNSADRGGAIASLSDSNPDITECTFTENFALTDGGAILSFEGLYTATDCSFSQNLALAANGRGGAICNILSDDSPEIENCTFEFNSAALGFGGAMAFDGEISGTVVTGCTVTENGAARGGGMWMNASSPSITDCVLESNSASEVGAVESGGGGMHIRNDSDPIVTNTTFLGNLAAARGGGLFIDDDSDPQFFNCVIRKNDADLSDLDSGGGFLSRDKSFPMFTDCTICFNNPNQRTGIFVDGGGNVITNCGCPGACPADFNGDGIIDGGDIGILLSFWGFEGGKCSFDLNGDGIIDGGDLGLMLGLFGPCGAG